MDTQNLVVGSRVEHALHGPGVVTFVSTDYLGIAFDASGEALIRREAWDEPLPLAAASPEPDRSQRPWPASTFAAAKDDTQHFLGSHWEPFFEDNNDLVALLPQIVPKALVQTGYGDDHKPPRELPQDWPKGFQLVWPGHEQGLALVLRIEAAGNAIVSMFPYFAAGGRQVMALREVTVWAGGLEAQVTATWGEGEVTFFDSRYVLNRGWYEAGKDYEFNLSGLAYSAGPAEVREWTRQQHPDVVAWMNQRLQPGETPHEETVTITLDGAALLMPISDWDVDDYSFHAPVRSVSEFKCWLGQDGWCVRATVMRFGDEDADLDILISRRAWSGQVPPQVGQDIEGRLWLQGSLADRRPTGPPPVEVKETWDGPAFP